MSANPIEQRTTTTLSKSYFLLRQSHLCICSLTQTPDCIWCPWTKIIWPEGDLRHHGFLLKKMASNQHAASWRARKPSQSLLVVHLPDVKAQRQKVIVSKWPHPLAQRGNSHVVDTAGPTLPRPCRTHHGAKFGREICQMLAERLSRAFHAPCLNLSSWKMGLLSLYSYSQIFRNTCHYVAVHIITIDPWTFMKHHIWIRRINEIQSLSSRYLMACRSIQSSFLRIGLQL